VLRLIPVILGITVHQRGPDQLPSSPFLVLLLLGASECAQLVTLRMAAAPDDAILVMLSSVAMDFLFVWGVLVVFERRQRFWQTMSAFLGVGVVLNVISAVLIAWNQSLQAPANTTTAPEVLLQLLEVWFVDIGGFLLSRAIDRHYALGVVIMLGYVLLSASVVSTLLLSSGV
jgi:hypothetical protein